MTIYYWWWSRVPHDSSLMWLRPFPFLFLFLYIGIVILNRLQPTQPRFSSVGRCPQRLLCSCDHPVCIGVGLSLWSYSTNCILDKGNKLIMTQSVATNKPLTSRILVALSAEGWLTRVGVKSHPQHLTSGPSPQFTFLSKPNDPMFTYDRLIRLLCFHFPDSKNATGLNLFDELS